MFRTHKLFAMLTSVVTAAVTAISTSSQNLTQMTAFAEPAERSQTAVTEIADEAEVPEAAYAEDSEPLIQAESYTEAETVSIAAETLSFTADPAEVELNYSRGEAAPVALNYTIPESVGTTYIRGYHPVNGAADWSFGYDEPGMQIINIVSKHYGTVSLHFTLVQKETDVVLAELYVFVRVTSDEMEFVSDMYELTLNLTHEESEIISLSYANLPADVKSVYIHAIHGENRLTTWDLSNPWSNGTLPIKIAGWKRGTEVLTFELVNTDTEKVLKTLTVTVNVKGDSFAFYPSQNQLEIANDPSAAKTIRMCYENMPDTVKTFHMRYVHGENPVSEVKWGEWVGHSADMTVTPVRSGSERLKIQLINSDTDFILLETYVDVIVKGSELEFYASDTALTINRSRGETATLMLTYANCPESVHSLYISAKHGNDPKTEWNWGSWASRSIDITFTGIADGTETLTFALCDFDTKKELATLTVDVTVSSDDVEFVSSEARVSISGKTQKTILLTVKRKPANVQDVMFSISTTYQCFSYEFGISEGDTASVILTGKQNGTEYFTVDLVNSADDSVLATLRVPVTVTDCGEAVQPDAKFVWGRDNWNFVNQSPDYFADSRYIDQISEPYLTMLKNNLNNSEYIRVFKGQYYNGRWYEAMMNEVFGGSCYGMSTLIQLGVNGLFPYAEWDSSASCIHDFNYPIYDAKLNSLITYYQMLQVKGPVSELMYYTKISSHEQNIKRILSELEKNETAVVCFQQKDWGGHAVLTIGAETGTFYRPENDRTYQGRILICDPNSSPKQADDRYIYYDTDTFAWMIPHYYHGGVSSDFGAVFCLVTSDTALLNTSGLFGNTPMQAAEGTHLANMEMAAVSESHYITKVARSGGKVSNMVTASDDIIADESFRMLGSAQSRKAGYILRDSESAYKVHQNIAEVFKATLNSSDASMSISANALNDAIFDRTGYLAFSGEASDYSFGLTLNETDVTDWFFIGVSGEGAKTAELEQVEKGYLLTADCMKNVQVSALNRKQEAAVRFSCDYDSVLIYEIDPLTIGIAADTDGDGKYEKTVAKTELLMGDLNGDGALSVADCVVMRQLLNEDTAFRSASANNAYLADLNGDGLLSVTDFAALLKLVKKAK